MADVIDDLKVQIDASTQNADAKLDKFIAKMVKLQSTITGIEISNVGQIASGINQIAASVQGFNERTNKADFNRIAAGMSKIASVNAVGVSNTARAMASFVNSMSGTTHISFDASSVDSIATAIGKLGRVSVGNATMNLQTLKTDLKEFVDGMNRVETLRFNPDSLVKVVSSISKLGGMNATQSVKNLPQITKYLSEFVTGINAIGGVTFGLSGLEDLVNSISRLGGVKATQAAANLKPIKEQILRFVSGLNGIGALNFDTTNLTNLVSSITKLGGKAAGNSIGNIQQLGVALKGMMKTLSTAPAVSQNLIQMTNALAALASNGNRVSSASNAMYRGLNQYSSGAKKAQVSSHGLASAIGRVYATYWMLFRAFSWFGKAINISSDLTEVQNVIDVSFGNMAGMVDKFTSNSIQKFGMSELAAKKMAGVYMAMGRSLGAPQKEMANMSIELTKLAADMSSFYNVSQEDVGEDLRSVFTGMVRPLRDYGIDLTQANLQQYALAQGIKKPVAAMSQLEKVQLRYNYVMQQTAGIQGDYQRTAGTWANQVRLLCQQLGAIVGGTLINAFKPFLTAMNAVISKVIAVAKAISDALGKIFGWTFEASGGGAGTAGIVGDLEDAAGAADDLGGGAGGAADKLGDAAKNAKKLAGNLQAFDKLNVITSPNDSGGSGGSGGGASGGTDAGNYGEWVQGESILDHYKSDIDNLFELGEYIGETLTSAMNNIDWDRVYERARGFGSGLANFLNGLISPELFDATGRTIAGALNTSLHFLDSFGITFDWKDFGNSIAAGINGFFGKFDFNLMVDTFNVWAVGILETMSTAISNVSWSGIAEKVSSALKRVDWEGILHGVGEVVWAAFSAVVETTSTLFDIDEKSAAKVAGAIGGALVAIKGFSGISKAITNIKKVSPALNTLFKLTGPVKYVAIAGGITGVVYALDKFGIIKVNWSSLAAGFKNLASALEKFAKGIGQGLINFIDGVTPIITPALGTAVKVVGSSFEILSNVLNSIPESVVSGLTTTLLSLFGAFKTYEMVVKAGGLIQVFAGNLKLFASVLPGIFNSGSILKNLAAALGPSALGGIAFTAIGGGLLLIAQRIMRVTDEAANNSAIGEFSNALGELNDEVSSKTNEINANLDRSREAVENAGVVEAQIARDLAAEYNELSSKAGLSADEKERLKQVSEKLVEIIPNLKDYLDEETDCLNIQKESLDAVIQGYESMAQKQAAQEYLVQAYKDQYETQMNVNRAVEGWNDLADEFITNNEGMSETVKELIKAGDIQALEDLKHQVWDVNGSAQQLQYWFGESAVNGKAVDKMLGDLTGTMSEYDSTVQDAQDTLDKANYQLDTMKGTVADCTQKEKEAIEAVTEAKMATDDYQQSLSDLNTEFSNLDLTLSEDFMQNLALDDFDPTVLQEFFNALAEGVPASAESIKAAFEELGLTLPDELTKALSTKEATVQSECTKILVGIQSGVQANEGQLKTLFSNLGINLPDELIKNLSEKESSVQTSATNLLSEIEVGHSLMKRNLTKIFAALGLEIPEALITSLSDQNSATQEQAIELLGQISAAEESERQPLIEKFNSLGAGIADEGVIKALMDKTGETTTATTSYINDGIKKPLEDEKEPIRGEGEGIGKNIVFGVNSGIENNAGSTHGAIRTWVSGITGFFKDLLGIASPSKVFGEFGGFTVSGFNDGVEGNMKSSFSLVEKWAKGVSNAFDIANPLAPELGVTYTANTPMLQTVDAAMSIRIPDNLNTSFGLDVTADLTTSMQDVKVANSEMIAELRRQNELLQIIANKPVIDKGDVVDAWKSGAKDFRKETGKQLGIVY